MPHAIPSEKINELLASLQLYQDEINRPAERPIHVSEITSLPAFAYEKLRNIVDYKEENLLRKNAIRRFLKRKFLLPQFNPTSSLGADLLRELVLSRYLPNDEIDEALIPDLNNIIKKYYTLFNKIKLLGCRVPRWREQLIGLAAVECDNTIVSPRARTAFTNLATKIIKPALDLSALSESTDQQNVQLVLNIERILNRADRDILNYYLLLHYHAPWFNTPENEAVEYLAPRFESILNEFNSLQNHILGKRLIPLIKRWLVPIVILRQTIINNPTRTEELIRNPQKLEQAARETYQSYWLSTRKRLRRKGFHAMTYIFITKILLAILIELPYEHLILGKISYIPLGINLLFPPLLMMIITLLIKSPDKSNEEKILEGVKEIVYEQDYSFYANQRLLPRRPHFFTKLFYTLLYTATMLVSFSAIIFVLWRLNFNVLSGALFIFFVSLVSFFGINLRQQARQLKVVRGRETITSFILDFFSFPIIALGKWLSNTFDRYNFFVFILDFMFEVPFKSILRVIEDWFHFLKEKKEEMM